MPKNELPKTLIFLGPQGSGKDTQARLLADKFGYKIFDTGTILREISREDTELGRRVKTTIDGGNLVDAELASEVIAERLAQLRTEEKVIVVGYPRGMRQYELLKESWAKLGRDEFLAIYVNITDEEAIKRITLRAEKEGRADDALEAVKKRLAWSRSEVDPMVDEMEKEGRVIRIDGMPSIEGIHQDILSQLGVE
jgi:adenylate kinase